MASTIMTAPVAPPYDAAEMDDALADDKGAGHVQVELGKLESLKRSADYLDSVAVRTAKPQCQSISWVGAVKALAFGSHLSLGDTVEGSRQQSFDENVNLGVISALFGTMVLPAAFSNTSDVVHPDHDAEYLESGFAYLFELRHGRAGSTMADVSHFSFWLSALSILICLVICVTNLLSISELGTDQRVFPLMERMGFWARTPYVMLSLGVVLSVPGLAIRWMFSSFSFEVAIVECVIVLGFALVLLYVHLRIVKNMFGVLHDSTEYCPVVLDSVRLQEDLQRYLKNDPDPSLKGFLDALACVTQQGCIVLLSDHTCIRAKIVYLHEMAKVLGVGDSKEDIARQVILRQLSA